MRSNTKDICFVHTRRCYTLNVHNRLPFVYSTVYHTSNFVRNLFIKNCKLKKALRVLQIYISIKNILFFRFVAFWVRKIEFMKRKFGIHIMTSLQVPQNYPFSISWLLICTINLCQLLAAAVWWYFCSGQTQRERKLYVHCVQ